MSGPEWIAPDTWGCEVKRRRAATVRIPTDLWEALQDEGRRLGYPPAWLLARILREWLADPPSSITLTRYPDDDGEDG